VYQCLLLCGVATPEQLARRTLEPYTLNITFPEQHANG
jgi:hypothetical protein